MSLTIPDFWRLLAESRLLTQAQVQRLASDFSQEKFVQEKNKAQPTPRVLAQWLMDHRAISKYQATVLLAGRAGPFFYGDYKVYERADKGWLTGCFRAVHQASKHPVALRFLTGPVLTNPPLWTAASANTLAAAQIVSPYVQRHFEAVDLQKFKVIVSEDVRGAGMDEKFAEGKMRPAEACRIMRLVALGLAEMHSRGRACGDVRLASVVLEAAPNEPNVKLMYDAHVAPGPIDFSQAGATEALATRAEYLAPELLTPGRPPDALSDIYALGCTLYALLSGTLPFAGGTVEQKLARHLSEAIRPLETFGLPQPLGQLVTYLMAKNPAVRYQSAVLVAEQLGMFVEPAAIRIAPPAEPPTLGAYEQVVVNKQGSGFGVQGSGQRGQGTGERERGAGDGGQAGAPPVVVVGRAPVSRGSMAAEIVRRKKAQQKRNVMIVAGLSALALVVGIGGAGVWWAKQQPAAPVAKTGGSSTPTPVQPSPDVANTKGEAPQSGDAGGSATGTAAESSGSTATAKSSGVVGASGAAVVQQVVPDDGKALWASPTAGKPVTLRCVPPEGQLFMILRPAAMLASEEGRRVIAALGPALDAERKKWEAASGLKLEEVEQLTITLHNNEGKFPRASFVVKTKEPISTEQLLTKWGNPEAVKEGEGTYYTKGAWAFFIAAAAEDERTFAMGEARDMKDVAAAGGGPPAVFREIERLRRMTDDQRHFTLLFYPTFLFNDDGEPLFAAERAKVRQPLGWLLGDHVQAASASAFFGDEFYFELRMRASLDKEPHALALELKDRLDKIPASLEDYFVTLNPPPYWRKLANRYPGMVRELHNQMRSGVEAETAIVNSVLASAAAHNLVLGGELLVSTAPGQAVASAGPVASSGPKTIAEALQVKTSYSFDQQSLEFAMRDLAEDVKGNLKGAPFEFAIKIIGDDLKLDGITRNQSIRDFKQENQTVADILTALVRKANPVTTVKDPSETDQKLVWLIGPDPDSPGKQAVLITTRNAAGTKKYTLPPHFVAKKK